MPTKASYWDELIWLNFGEYRNSTKMKKKDYRDSRVLVETSFKNYIDYDSSKYNKELFDIAMDSVEKILISADENLYLNEPELSLSLRLGNNRAYVNAVYHNLDKLASDKEISQKEFSLILESILSMNYYSDNNSVRYVKAKDLFLIPTSIAGIYSFIPFIGKEYIYNEIIKENSKISEYSSSDCGVLYEINDSKVFFHILSKYSYSKPSKGSIKLNSKLDFSNTFPLLKKKSSAPSKDYLSLIKLLTHYGINGKDIDIDSVLLSEFMNVCEYFKDKSMANLDEFLSKLDGNWDIIKANNTLSQRVGEVSFIQKDVPRLGTREIHVGNTATTAWAEVRARQDENELIAVIDNALMDNMDDRIDDPIDEDDFI